MSIPTVLGIPEHRHGLREGTAAQWAAANPVLGAGEAGRETDTLLRKVGDGLTAWHDLPYEAGGSITGLAVLDCTGAFTPPVSPLTQEWTLTGDTVLTLPTPDYTGTAVCLTVSIVQDAAGGHALTWDPAIKWPSAVAPVLSTTASGESVVTFLWSASLGWRGFVSGADMAVA